MLKAATLLGVSRPLHSGNDEEKQHTESHQANIRPKLYAREPFMPTLDRAQFMETACQDTRLLRQKVPESAKIDTSSVQLVRFGTKMNQLWYQLSCWSFSKSGEFYFKKVRKLT